MKSVLMISPYFVPRQRVGALRTFKFAIHLKNFGYNPIILTIKDSQSLASEAEKKLLDELKIIELSTPIDRTVQAEKVSNKKEHPARIQGKFASWIDKNTPSDTWIYFYLSHFFKVLKYAKTVNPDVVWATGDPWSSLILGSSIAKKMSVPFVSDFRDPWTRSGISLRDRSSFSKYWDKKLECNVLSHASKVVFTSKSAEKDYLENFKSLHGKTSVIYNAANDQVDSAGRHMVESSMAFKSDDLNVIFFGTFRRLSPISPVADMLAELRHQSPEALSNIKIHSFGEPEEKHLKYAQRKGVLDQFVFHQKVKPEVGESILGQADIHLVSTHPNRCNIVPAKLWDYLNTDMPVLSIAPNPEVGELLAEYDGGAHFHPDDLQKAAKQLGEWKSIKQKYGADKLRRVPLSDSQRRRISSREKARLLASIFDELTSHE